MATSTMCEGKVFGLILVGFRSASLPKGYWSRCKVALTALGATVGQNGENEGTILFDPQNNALNRAILTWGKITRKRVGTPRTPEQIAKFKAVCSRKWDNTRTSK